MNIDQLHSHLQSDLRFVLENPTDSAKADLLKLIESLVGNVREQYGNDSSVWWMNQIINSVRSFSRFPTKEEFNRITRMSSQYYELCTSGIIQPVGIARKKQFDNLTDWFSQELEDRASAVINKPTEDNLKTLRCQLEVFCQRNGIELA
jgi:hypothetical protein